jgi:hypothetical protein
MKRKERESNPQGLRAHPFSRRDTAPVAVLPGGGPGRRRTCTVPGKNRELCRLELRSLDDVTGRDRTCDAPRFRRALYRAELRPHDRRSRSRTGRLLGSERNSTTWAFQRWARVGLELNAAPEPRFSELPLQLPGVSGRGPPEEAAPLRPSPDPGDRRSRRAPPVGPRSRSLSRPGKPNDVFYATRLPFDPGSATAGCAHLQRFPSYVEELWSPNLTRRLEK